LRLEFAPRAVRDLEEIAGYIAEDNPERATSFVDELERRCADLLHYPESGRDRSELAQRLRSKPHGSYVNFYTPDIALIRIERILHGARDLEAAFGGEED
jgi:toxin ParE1/3/4